MRCRRQTLAWAFGHVLRMERRTAQLSQNALATKADIDNTHVSLLERGQRSPTIEIIYALAEALNLAPEALLTKTSERRSIRARESAVPLLPTAPASTGNNQNRIEPQPQCQRRPQPETRPEHKVSKTFKLQQTTCAHMGGKKAVGNVIRCNLCNRPVGFVRAPIRLHKTLAVNSG